MSSLYIHIPFCKSRCIYCDFFSTTKLERRQAYVDAVCREMQLRHNYLGDHTTVNTIYIGGGTPSQLSARQIGQLIDAAHTTFDINPTHEATIELNPSDVTPSLATELKTIGLNRVSLGIQTFNDNLLRLIGRRHDSLTAINAVKTLQQAGFDNISIDLIYGLPNQSLEQWGRDISAALNLGIQHLSAYSLMYEEGTRLFAMLEAGQVAEADEELSLSMYQMLVDRLKEAGFEHYEISNFALPLHRSRHNSSYWDGTPYIGLGAGAHSYDRQSRCWNVADIDTYIDNIACGQLPLECEHLDTDKRYNEMVMTRLRRADGLNVNEVESEFGTRYLQHLETAAQQYIDSGLLTYDASTRVFTLSNRGIFTSNDIISSLFV